MSGNRLKNVWFIALGVFLYWGMDAMVFAVSGQGIGGVAANVTSNLGPIAKLITAAAYVAGFGFAVAAIVKFKAHKDNPTQVPISQGIVLLFVGSALIFAPSVFKTSGSTLFTSGQVGAVSGITTFK